MNCKRKKVKGKSPIVNRPSHSLVTDASGGAHLRFQGLEPAVCRRCFACHMGLHSITRHPIQANPSLPYVWEKGQTSAYYCRNFPGSEAGTNLYCLVDKGTCVWTTCPRSLPGSVAAWSRTCDLSDLMIGLQVQHVTGRLPSHTQKEKKLRILLTKIWETCSTEGRQEICRLKHACTEKTVTTVDEMVGLINHKGQKQAYCSTRQISKET